MMNAKKDTTSFCVLFGGVEVALTSSTASACSSVILTSVLPYSNAMSQTQDMRPHAVTVYRDGADLSCYSLMRNVTLEYTTAHFKVTGQTRPGYPSPTFHTCSKRSTL